MSSNFQPYNFTITDQSPLFQYSPYKDGLASGGWNASYASGISNGRFGIGASSHSTTFAGATAQLNWIGTAIYLYGEGSSYGYTINIDGTTTTPGVSNTPGLLFSQSGLTYGPHSLILSVVQSATISSAIVTVGMGEVGSTVQTRIINTIDNITTNDYQLSSGWVAQTTYGKDPDVPRLGTSVSGASITFTLTSASAFYISGSVNENHGSYDVKMTPSLNIVPQTFNGFSHWVGLNATIYLATGMDSSTTYQVVLANDTPNLWVDLSEIVVYNTIPPPQSGPSSSQSGSSPSQTGVQHNAPGPKHVGIGLIVGVAAGGAFILVMFLAFLIYFRRRRRRQDTGQPASFTTESRPFSTTFSASNFPSNFPPEPYATSWDNRLPEAHSGHSVPVLAAGQYNSREGMQSPQGGPGSPAPSSPTNAHSERTWSSGPMVDHYEYPGQPLPVHGGSGTSRPSTSTDWRVTSMSDRSSVPSVPFDQNEYRVASPPMDAVKDTPPAYRI